MSVAWITDLLILYVTDLQFNMGTLHAALPQERDPNAGAASQWSQSQPQYPHAPAPGTFQPLEIRGYFLLWCFKFAYDYRPEEP